MILILLEHIYHLLCETLITKNLYVDQEDDAHIHKKKEKKKSKKEIYEVKHKHISDTLMNCSMNEKQNKKDKEECAQTLHYRRWDHEADLKQKKKQQKRRRDE